MSTSGNDRFPFESPEQRTLDQVRRDGTTPQVAGYQTDLGEIFPVPGDQTAPYGHVLGRASSTGTTPNTVEDEEPQRVLVDQFGRIWCNTAPGSVQNVQGNIANDEPDLNSFPVKVGGRAVLTPSTGQVPAVAVDDRVNAAFDINGRQIVVAGGDVAADSPDAGRPVKVGGVAGDPTTGLAAVTLADRVNAAFDINGRQIALAQGNVASDAVDAGFPVKIGGIAYTTAPAPVSADADRVNAIFDRSGRQQMGLPQALAGENLIVNAQRIVRAKLQVQQESWLPFRLDNVTGAVIKSEPGRIARLVILNTSATPLYVIVHDSTTFTVLGTIIWEGFVPAAVGAVPGLYEDDWESSDGLFCSIGISVVTSTGVAAIAGSVQIYGNALYF